jgi:hypothetical protein
MAVMAIGKFDNKRLRVCLVWLLAFAPQKPKANQRAQNPYLHLPKASFFVVQIQKQVSPAFPGCGCGKFEEITHCHSL